MSGAWGGGHALRGSCDLHSVFVGVGPVLVRNNNGVAEWWTISADVHLASHLVFMDRTSIYSSSAPDLGQVPHPVCASVSKL